MKGESRITRGSKGTTPWPRPPKSAPLPHTDPGPVRGQRLRLKLVTLTKRATKLADAPGCSAEHAEARAGAPRGEHRAAPNASPTQNVAATVVCVSLGRTFPSPTGRRTLPQPRDVHRLEP